MQYAVFEDLISAEEAIVSINRARGFLGTWCYPLEHPIDCECLILIDWTQLQGCEPYIGSREIIDAGEAKFRGWDFGPFTGPLAREQQKLEDMYFLLDAVDGMYGSPNFPALRSLTLSFLSAAYALRENLKRKAESVRHEGSLGGWWKLRKKELDEPNELLKSLEIFMNTEKHGGRQRSKIDLVPAAQIGSLIIEQIPPNADVSTLTLSAEGAFAVIGLNTSRERRVPVGLHEARYEIQLQSLPDQHLGKSISATSFIETLHLVMEYYALLVFQARELLGEIPPPLNAAKSE
jgi:hypothetical protein